MAEKTTAERVRKQRVLMFPNGRTVSFRMDGDKLKKVVKAAYCRKIPFSMWMREAAEEKFAREVVAK